MNSDDFANFCTALGSPNDTSVEIAKGISVNAATINYAIYVNQVCQEKEYVGEILNTRHRSARHFQDVAQADLPPTMYVQPIIATVVD